MPTDLTHLVQFLQTAYTILLGLALGEALKQFVPDGDQPIKTDRLPLLLAFLFMVFPFFHGMSRYLYTTYLTHPEPKLGPVAGHVMLDGLVFMILAGLFFVLSRSLSESHWRRFYGFLLALLAVDSVWILTCLSFGADFLPWLWLNVALALVLTFGLLRVWPEKSRKPLWICAGTTFCTTIVSYFWLSGFYFPG
jgi:hypothetical protein